MRKFYVYEWYIVDTGEVFYVGKGTGKRYKEYKRRNKMFLDFYKTHECKARFVHIDLNEDEAFYLEHLTIMYYLQNTKFRLTNQNTGGNGGQTSIYKTQAQIEASEKRKGISVNIGENNGMYGKNWTEGKTPKEIKEIGDKISNSLKGHKPTEEQRKHQSESAKKRGMHSLEKYYEEKKRPVMIIENESGRIVAEYDTIQDAKGNPYIKGHLGYKAIGKKPHSKNDKYTIMFKSYKIEEKIYFI